MGKKYTRTEISNLIYETVEEAIGGTYPDYPPSAFVADLVGRALFDEGIFDPNQVQGA